MQVEIHQIELRYTALRLTAPKRLARLTASIAREGQRSPVLVVSEGDRYILIDGYKRVAAVQSLSRDVVEATVLQVSTSEALIWTWKMEASRRRTALEEGWLVQELVEGHQLSQAALAVHLGRSRSWVSRRLSLVEVLPESVQDAVRTGVVPAQGAMKFLVPLSRDNTEHCKRLVRNLGSEAVTVRQVERLYLAWRRGDKEQRERLIANPLLFLKAEEAITPSDVEADEFQQLVSELESISSLCRRIRRRLREGVFTRAKPHGTSGIERAWQETQIAYDNLAVLLKKEVCCD